jgi:hypothetical protein
MIKKIIILFFIIAFTKSAPAASKITAVQEALDLKCNMKVNDEEALKYIKVLFLTCVPRTTVEVSATCTITCMKASPGMIIGR